MMIETCYANEKKLRSFYFSFKFLVASDYLLFSLGGSILKATTVKRSDFVFSMETSVFFSTRLK